MQLGRKDAAEFTVYDSSLSSAGLRSHYEVRDTYRKISLNIDPKFGGPICGEFVVVLLRLLRAYCHDERLDHQVESFFQCIHFFSISK